MFTAPPLENSAIHAGASYPAAIVPAYLAAKILTGPGRKDEALTRLEKAYEQRSVFVAWLKPEMDDLRSEPRFQSLLHRLGFAA